MQPIEKQTGAPMTQDVLAAPTNQQECRCGTILHWATEELTITCPSCGKGWTSWHSAQRELRAGRGARTLALRGDDE